MAGAESSHIRNMNMARKPLFSLLKLRLVQLCKQAYGHCVKVAQKFKPHRAVPQINANNKFILGIMKDRCPVNWNPTTNMIELMMYVNK